MICWVMLFFIIDLLAGLLGFGGLAGPASGIAQVLFFVFLAVFLLSIAMGLIGQFHDDASSWMARAPAPQTITRAPQKREAPTKRKGQKPAGARPKGSTRSAKARSAKRVRPE